MLLKNLKFKFWNFEIALVPLISGSFFGSVWDRNLVWFSSSLDSAWELSLKYHLNIHSLISLNSYGVCNFKNLQFWIFFDLRMIWSGWSIIWSWIVIELIILDFAIGLLHFSEFCTAIFEPDLNSSFWQVRAKSQSLTSHYIWILKKRVNFE